MIGYRPRGVVALAFGLIAACSGSTTPDDTDHGVPPNFIIMPVGTLQFFALPGETIQNAPAVRVVSSPGGKGIVNVPVTFTREGPDGDITSYTAVTNSYGEARIPGWPLGSVSGQYHLRVTSGETTGPVFTAFARGNIVAIYDLVRVAGKEPIPGYPITHYALYDDGSFFLYQDKMASSPTGSYKTPEPGTVAFYLDPQTPLSAFYAPLGFLFSIGKISGSAMTVSYQDYVDYEIEVYALRESAAPHDAR